MGMIRNEAYAVTRETVTDVEDVDNLSIEISNM